MQLQNLYFGIVNVPPLVMAYVGSERFYFSGFVRTFCAVLDGDDGTLVRLCLHSQSDFLQYSAGLFSLIFKFAVDDCNCF